MSYIYIEIVYLYVLYVIYIIILCIYTKIWIRKTILSHVFYYYVLYAIMHDDCIAEDYRNLRTICFRVPLLELKTKKKM